MFLLFQATIFLSIAFLGDFSLGFDYLQQANVLFIEKVFHSWKHQLVSVYFWPFGKSIDTIHDILIHTRKQVLFHPGKIIRLCFSRIVSLSVPGRCECFFCVYFLCSFSLCNFHKISIFVFRWIQTEWNDGSRFCYPSLRALLMLLRKTNTKLFWIYAKWLETKAMKYDALHYYTYTCMLAWTVDYERWRCYEAHQTNSKMQF